MAYETRSKNSSKHRSNRDTNHVVDKSKIQRTTMMTALFPEFTDAELA